VLQCSCARSFWARDFPESIHEEIAAHLRFVTRGGSACAGWRRPLRVRREGRTRGCCVRCACRRDRRRSPQSRWARRDWLPNQKGWKRRRVR